MYAVTSPRAANVRLVPLAFHSLVSLPFPFPAQLSLFRPGRSMPRSVCCSASLRALCCALSLRVRPSHASADVCERVTSASRRGTARPHSAAATPSTPPSSPIHRTSDKGCTDATPIKMDMCVCIRPPPVHDSAPRMRRACSSIPCHLRNAVQSTLSRPLKLSAPALCSFNIF